MKNKEAITLLTLSLLTASVVLGGAGYWASNLEKTRAPKNADLLQEHLLHMCTDKGGVLAKLNLSKHHKGFLCFKNGRLIEMEDL